MPGVVNNADGSTVKIVELQTGGSPVESANPLPVSLGTGGSSALPSQTAPFLNVQAAPPKTNRMGFSAAIASGFDPLEMTTVVTGSGMAISQAGGSAIITTGTTANAETIGRSLGTVDGDIRVRFFHTLSQRIANNSFFIEMVDLVGDNLAVTVNSATSVTITIPGTTLNANNVGQSIYIGNIAGIAAAIPGRYAIASIAGNAVTFTVAGWPGSGSGTASLFGLNYHHVLYDGVTATSAKYGCQRTGYATADITIATSTTTSGELGLIQAVDAKASFYDGSGAAAATLAQRTSTPRNVPVDGIPLYLQVRALNGTVAPATTTTWTIGFCETENFIAQSTSIDNVSAQSQETTVPVSSPGTLTVGGVAIQSAAASGNPVQVGGVVNTAVDTTLVQGDMSNFFVTSNGAMTQKPYAAPEVDWTYAAAAGGISNTTTAVTVKVAGAAGVRNYITGLQLSASALGAATEFAIRDGAAGTVLWRCVIPTAGISEMDITFPTPLRGTAATLLEIVTLTASITGSVYCNLQGYQAI